MTSTQQALVLASVGDPEGTRTIAIIVAVLAVVGVVLIVVAIWFFRSTRPDPELLAPLEVMGDEKWRRSGTNKRRARLDDVRPAGEVTGIAGSEHDELILAAPADQTVTGDPDADGPGGAEYDATVAVELGEHVPDEAAADSNSHGDGSDHAADDAGPVEGDTAATSGDRDEADDREAVGEHDDVQAGDEQIDDGRDGDAQSSAPDEHSAVDGDEAEDEAAGDPSTPPGSPRPSFDELPDGEIDPNALAAAIAELDAEFERRDAAQPSDDTGE